MDAVRKDVRRLVNKELEAANKRFRQFASPHEGQNVVREELEEAEQAIVPLKLYIEHGCGMQSRQTRPCRKMISGQSGKRLSIWPLKLFR